MKRITCFKDGYLIIDLIASRDQAESAKTDYDVGKWPRVLVITSQESQNLPIKEYAIRKAITGLTTNPRKLYQAKAGHYVVEVETDATSKTLLKTTVMAGHPVKVTPHRSLNSSRGVITSRFINGASDADLLDDLKDQGVTKAFRILRNRREETNTVILTFDSPTPKKQVLIMNQVLDVKIYVARPIRCFKCQKFGHTKARCTKKQNVCGKCSETHLENECTATTPKCANCNGEHHSFDRKCPKYIEKKSILEISAKKHISIKDAEKELKNQNNASYAKALKKNVIQNKRQATETTNKMNSVTNFVPDRLQTLQNTVLKQHQQHQQEIADIKAHIRDLKNDHVAELRERENIIMNQEQQIQEQEIQIQKQNALIKQQEKQIAELSLLAKTRQVKNNIDSESKDMTSAESPSQNIAAPAASPPSLDATPVSPALDLTATSVPNNVALEINPAAIKLPKTAGRTSSVKRAAPLSPEGNIDLQRSKRDRKSISPKKSLTSPRPRSPSSKRSSPTTTRRSRSLKKWVGPREKTRHNSSKSPSSSPPPKAKPSSPAKGPVPPNLNKDGGTQ